VIFVYTETLASAGMFFAQAGAPGRGNSMWQCRSICLRGACCEIATVRRSKC